MCPAVFHPLHSLPAVLRPLSSQSASAAAIYIATATSSPTLKTPPAIVEHTWLEVNSSSLARLVETDAASALTTRPPSQIVP